MATPHYLHYKSLVSRSKGEDAFLGQIRTHGLPIPEREKKLISGRRWSFDFVWENERVVVEIEGGVYSGGRHTRGKGFTDDCYKYNSATANGYSIFRFTTEMVKTGEAIQFLSKLFQRKVTETPT